MNSAFSVLIVEDDANIARFMAAVFSANDYQVLLAGSGAEALRLFTSRCPDVLLLDLGLPDMDGTAIIRKLREWSQTPIIVVSARTQEREKVTALDAGADDYVTKPFGTSELLARVRTALRHASARKSSPDAPEEGTFRAGGLVLDYGSRRVSVDGESVRLTQIEYKILSLLARYAGRVLTYDFMVRNVWGPGAKYDNQLLRVNMANIRRKIEKNPAAPRYILTEIGVGYRMTEED